MKSIAGALELPLQKSRITPLLQIVAASFFIGLCAQIKIPLYFTPVPLTGQTFAVLLIATLLNRHHALWATLLYLIEGAFGLPVWAGGASGLHHLFGPTGGYLLSYPLQVFLVSYLMKKQQSMHFLNTATALIFACCIQMGIGTLWLAAFVGAKQAPMMGFYPFLPGEIFKSLIVTSYFLKFKSRSNDVY